MTAINKVLYSSHFAKAFKKLSHNLKTEVVAHEKIFITDCFDPRLKTHKLKGKHKDLWSFSITYKHRLIFKFLAEDAVYFVDVGDHSIDQ